VRAQAAVQVAGRRAGCGIGRGGRAAQGGVSVRGLRGVASGVAVNFGFEQKGAKGAKRLL